MIISNDYLTRHIIFMFEIIMGVEIMGERKYGDFLKNSRILLHINMSRKVVMIITNDDFMGQ